MYVLQIRRVVRTAIFVNLLGLLASLIGAEQFVGNLMARVLSSQVRGSPISSVSQACETVDACNNVHSFADQLPISGQGGFGPLIVQTNNAAQITAPTVQPIDIFVIQVR